MSIESRIAEQFVRRQRLIAAAVAIMRRAWGLGAPSRAVPMLQVIQRRAAADGALAMRELLTEQRITIRAVAKVNPIVWGDGSTADGRSLLRLVDLAEDLAQLERIAVNEVTDAGRTAAGVEIANRPGVVWTRMVNPPCCARCAILAGKTYRYSKGFERHPQCDCTHIPSTESQVDDVRVNAQRLFDEGHVQALTRAETKAIAKGADIFQVINARRNRYIDEAGMRFTYDGTRSQGGKPTPEQIYREAADDQAEAIRLLKRWGYLT